MDKFETFTGLVAPMDRANVDTDAIIPKQFLKSIKRSGFGPNLFDEWRYKDPGEPGMDHATRIPEPDFVLNRERYRDAAILLARENFGCGSSREHAVWALLDFGFRVVIAPSFAEIFSDNCFKNGVLPIVLADTVVDRLFNEQEQAPGYALQVDLSGQRMTTPAGVVIEIDVAAVRKDCLIQGIDDIGLTLAHAAEIRTFEAVHRQRQPWLFNVNIHK